MIEARPEPPFEAVAQRLAAKAQAIARTRALRRRLARRADPRRWRLAALLWPLFAKG